MSDDDVFPQPEQWDTATGSLPCQAGGLTKREYFAGLAMQAWLANSSSEAVASTVRDTAALAVTAADDLLAELAKVQP